MGGQVHVVGAARVRLAPARAPPPIRVERNLTQTTLGQVRT
jgi:hypothetical protein